MEMVSKRSCKSVQDMRDKKWGHVSWIYITKNHETQGCKNVLSGVWN
jgi:hypothetical protein